MSSPADRAPRSDEPTRGDHIVNEAERIVSRELDRLSLRLRSDAKRLTGEISRKDSENLRQILAAMAEAHSAAADLVWRIRETLRKTDVLHG